MDKYVTRSKIGYPCSSSTNPSTASTIAPKIQKKIFISDVDLESLEADPGIRKPIAEYNPNIRDDIRRYYIHKKPCQPKDHKFPKTKFGKEMQQFFPNWFKDRKWLEYSITKDVAFCLCCYLFKNEYESRGDVVYAAFTKTGFRAWNKATERFRAHVGDVNSIHYKCFNKMLDLMNESQSIRTSFDKKSKKEKSESGRRLSASVDVTRFLLKLGLSFRGHD
ncbi:zinc finger MYM-type protein 5-like [Solanum pennellii]|uniref:Zinc finger MYM-type protein 5-like n=1 Tax=Solanum pennellii TaxID=28526 RepID=A0ABM1HL41_SOLPN|nr:zinc finger MYM-type protein 5-like [Solanum pennellii]